MTKFRILIILSVTILLFSCQKEEVEQFVKEKEKISVFKHTKRNSNDCGYIDELCMPCDNRVDPAPPPKTPILVFARTEDGKSLEYTIKASPLFKGSSDFLLEVNQ